jgi:hypothetical protein
MHLLYQIAVVVEVELLFMIVMKIIYQAQSAAVNNTQSNAILNYALTNASKCKLIIRKRIKIYFTN